MNHRKISDRFNDLLELQRGRLLKQYDNSQEVSSVLINLIISHSYLNQWRGNALES